MVFIYIFDNIEFEIAYLYLVNGLSFNDLPQILNSKIHHFNVKRKKKCRQHHSFARMFTRITKS